MHAHILVVDQSTTDTDTLGRVLHKIEPGFELSVATTIDDGFHALTHHFDIILLNANLLDDYGISFIRHIVKNTTSSVIIVSDFSVQNAARTVSALAAGAVDYIRKRDMDQAYMLGLTSKIIRFISGKDFIKYERRYKNQLVTPNLLHKDLTVNKRKDLKLIAIGTSTGGPKALLEVLQQLPANFPTPILIVQHMPEAFTKKLADRLNKICSIEVVEAVHGEIIRKERAYIAPGNFHLLIKEDLELECLRIALEQGRDEYPHRPSVDVLFESMATIERINKVAVILTGMGKDGRNGIIKLKELDPSSIIIAESPETTVVDGMPKAAINTKLVTNVLPIHKIGKAIMKLG